MKVTKKVREMIQYLCLNDHEPKFSPGPLQEQWLQSLESGDYKQTTDVLCKQKSDESDTPKFCCLGVACWLTKGVYWTPYPHKGMGYWCANHKECSLPYEVLHNFKFFQHEGHIRETDKSLSALNDDHKFTFKEIATFVRLVPDLIFTESA